MTRRVRYVHRLARGPVSFRLSVRLSLGLLLGLLLWSDGGAPAWADNAFPSSQSVLPPPDRPQEIVVGTTFGLVFTEDDGASWTYVSALMP